MARNRNRQTDDHNDGGAVYVADEPQRSLEISRQNEGQLPDPDQPAPADPAPVPTEPLPEPAPKPAESKRDRFRRLANRRVPRAVLALKHVRNLANKSQYDYTEEDAKRVLEVMEGACKRMREAFSGKEEVQELFRL